MRIDAHDPQRFTGRRVERVNVAAEIAEVCGEGRRSMSFHRADTDGVTDAGRGLEAPGDASAFRIERVDVARIGPEKHAAAGNRRLAVHRSGVRYSECPLQFEIRDLGGAETCSLR